MTIQTIKNYADLFWQLLKTDLIIYRQNILSRLIDVVIVVSIVQTVFGFILPEAFGMSKIFGAFALIGMFANLGIFEIEPTVARFVGDVNGNNSISYHFTLPIPSWLIFIKSSVGNAFKTAVMSIAIFPVGKVILGPNLQFSNISIFKFAIAFVSVNLFYSIFSLWMCSIAKNLGDLGTIWVRILFPMWFFGAAQFPWQTIYKLSKPLSYVALGNPFLYTMEGLRAAFFGQEGYISYWLCIGVIWMSMIFFAWLGISRLKKRLDFI